MVQLARKEEAQLVKLAIPIIPMLSDYCFSDTAAMTKYEAEQAIGQRKIWRLIGGPDVGNYVSNNLLTTSHQFEEMRKDALLFPGKADEETLSKMPPTIVWEAEFNIYISEATCNLHIS